MTKREVAGIAGGLLFERALARRSREEVSRLSPPPRILGLDHFGLRSQHRLNRQLSFKTGDKSSNNQTTGTEIWVHHKHNWHKLQKSLASDSNQLREIYEVARFSLRNKKQSGMDMIQFSNEGTKKQYEHRQ